MIAGALRWDGVDMTKMDGDSSCYSLFFIKTYRSIKAFALFFSTLPSDHWDYFKGQNIIYIYYIFESGRKKSVNGNI